MINLEVIINESFHTKLNGDTFHKAQSETIELITTQAEEQCRLECPVVTGNLRDSHYVSVEDIVGKVLNTADYAGTVIYGDGKRSPNDYPQRALNNLEGTYEKYFIEALSTYGVLD